MNRRISPTEMRQDLYNVFKDVNTKDDCNPTYVESRSHDKDVVIISLELWNQIKHQLNIKGDKL